MERDRRPRRCQCDVDTWPTRDPIPAVCTSYVRPQDGRTFCKQCLHEPRCHGVELVRRRGAHRIEIVQAVAS